MTTAVSDTETTATEASATQQLVAFVLGREEYGVPITRVQEIIRFTPPRPMPDSPPHVDGVINLRGRIIPVIDLRQRLGTAGERTEDSKIVIVELQSATVGIEVDEVKEVLSVRTEDCEPAPQGSGAVSGEAIDSVAKLEGRLLMILNLDRLLGSHGLD